MRPPIVFWTPPTLKSNPPFEEQDSDPKVPTAWDHFQTLIAIIVSPFCICAVVFFHFLFSYCFILPLAIVFVTLAVIVEVTIILNFKILCFLLCHVPRYAIFAGKYAYWRVVSPFAGEHVEGRRPRLEDEYYVPLPPLPPSAIAASSSSPRISQVRGDEYWWQDSRVNQGSHGQRREYICL